MNWQFLLSPRERLRIPVSISCIVHGYLCVYSFCSYFGRMNWQFSIFLGLPIYVSISFIMYEGRISDEILHTSCSLWLKIYRLVLVIALWTWKREVIGPNKFKQKSSWMLWNALKQQRVHVWGRKFIPIIKNLCLLTRIVPEVTRQETCVWGHIQLTIDMFFKAT